MFRVSVRNRVDPSVYCKTPSIIIVVECLFFCLYGSRQVLGFRLPVTMERLDRGEEYLGDMLRRVWVQTRNERTRTGSRIECEGRPSYEYCLIFIFILIISYTFEMYFLTRRLSVTIFVNGSIQKPYVGRR